MEALGGGASPARLSGLRWKLKLRGRKHMKKKMLSLALALVMCLDLTVPAFASEYGPLEVRFEKKIGRAHV